jgi:hypothetical protein
MSKCPWHAGKIVAPCSLSTCEFYAPGHPLHCGFAAYQKLARSLKTNEEVSWETLADWLAVDKETLERHAQKAYAELKRAGIENFFLGSVAPVRQTRYCVVCARPAILIDGEFAYCSAACKTYLPSEALEAEIAWEHPIAELLNYLQNFDYRTATRYMKISKETYASLLWQHLGVVSEDLGQPRKKKAMHNPRLPDRTQLLRRLHASRLWAQQL